MHVGNNRKVKRTVLEEKKKTQTNNLRTNAIAKRICQERKCHARQSNWYIKYSGLLLRVQIQDQIPQEDKLSPWKIKYNWFIYHMCAFNLKKVWLNGIWQMELILTRSSSVSLDYAG